MNRIRQTNRLLLYRAHRRSKDWVRFWLFTSDETCPYLQFERLNPEE